MADRLSEFIYTDDSKEMVDVINLLLLGWILLGLVVYIVGNIVATQLRKKKETLPHPVTETSEPPTIDKPIAEPLEHVLMPSEIESELYDLKVKEQFDTLIPHSCVIPVCTGEDPEIVKWINDVFSWIYVKRVISPIVDAWLSALNSRARMASTEHGILIDFVDITPDCQPPLLTDLTANIDSRNNVIVSCQAEAQKLGFKVVITQFKEKDKNSMQYIINTEMLLGKLNIECIPEELIFLVKFSEIQSLKLEFKPHSSTMLPEADQWALEDVINEIISESFNLAVVNLRFSCFTECPQLALSNFPCDIKMVHSESTSDEEKLLVKIIKASDIGGNKGCIKPYCVIEMDEPAQRFETSEVEDKRNPFWDESFVFIIKDISAELLFELYDKGSETAENFLGLGIVSLEELLKNPSQRQIIPLQSRPLENDDVTGSLTAEFLFLDREISAADVTHLGPPHALHDGTSHSGKTIETNSRITPGGTIITTTTIKRTREENQKTMETDIKDKTSNLNNVHEFNYLNSVSQLQLKESENSVETEIKERIPDIIIHEIQDLPSVSEFDIVEEKNSVEIETERTSDIEIMHEIPDFPSVSQFPDVEESKNTVEVETKEFASTDINIMHETGNLTPILEFPNLEENKSVMETVIKENETDIENLHENQDLASVSEPPVIKDGMTDLADTALKELEKQDKPGAPSKSTLIIHSVQREVVQPTMKVKMDKSGRWQEVEEPASPAKESLEASPSSQQSKESRNSHQESLPSTSSGDKSEYDRSRPKDKKSFIGTLRKRLSFRKARSRSVEQQRLESESVYSRGSNRSISTDRSKSAPGSRETSSLRSGNRFLAVPGDSTRSSISEASGISGSSSRTYINENSTLVVETNENGIIKRYLIPAALVNRSKWKKRGIKLHIYNDHIFVAKHLSGSIPCEVCNKFLSRRPGKQGYVCRDCNLLCHKRCHVKVADFCPKSTINTMEVEYIQDPRVKPKSS